MEKDLHFVHDSDGEGTPTRRTRNKKKERISWIGNPVYTEDENKFYHAVKIDNIIYYLKDYIELPPKIVHENSKRPDTRRVTRSQKKGNGIQYDVNLVVGNIQRLWEKEGEKMCQINNVYTPEDTLSGRRPHHGAKELVKYENIEELSKPLTEVFHDIHTTPLKRIVESFEEFSNRNKFPEDVYYVHDELIKPKMEPSSQAPKSQDKNESTDDTRTTFVDTALDDDSSPPSTSKAINNFPTPSPSKRKNLRMIQDDADYIVVKKEDSQDELRPLRRLKRMRKIDDDVEENSDFDPKIEDSPKPASTPKRTRRVINDSDDEDFTESQPTRKSTRIPVLQQRKHEKFRSIVSKDVDDEEESESVTSEVDPAPSNDELTNDVAEGDLSVADQEPDDMDTVDLTNESASTSRHSTQKNLPRQESRKRDLSWIEKSERGKLAVPGVKNSLQFDTPKNSSIHSRITKATKASKQVNIKSFMTTRSVADFVNLVEEGEDKDKSTESVGQDPAEKTRKNERAQRRKSSETGKKSSRNQAKNSASFIPQLMFDDNNVDNDMQRHLKQQKLLHDLSRYSTANQDSNNDDGGRWGRTKRNSAPSVDMDDESDVQSNNSEYESDDFLVADDAPIETYEPSQDDLDDADDGDDSDEKGFEEDEDDIAHQNKNDQDGLFEHVFTNKQAFIVFLQYLISACADPDFISMMVDSDDQDMYFRPALRKIRDQIVSRKASLVQSSAWDDNFKESLENRPFYASWESQNPNLEDCHACLRANHPASWKVTLSGPSYNPEKYLNGHDLLDIPILPVDEENPEEDENFLLGRFCRKRTSLYHRLHFFHVHMLEKVKRKVDHTNADSIEELVQTILDNSVWMSEMTDLFSGLLTEADDFMNDSREIM